MAVEMTYRDPPASAHPPLVEFRNVSVVRGGRRVLDSVSVTIGEGESVAILGPNGAGKTSFVRTIARECYPLAQDGDTIVRIRGKTAWNVFELRSLLGIVSADLQHAFMREIAGRDVILSGFFSSIGLFRHAVTPAMEEKARAVMRFLEIEHLQDRPMTTLSGGEGRRFLIGRALVHDPKALLLDEPTTSLDLHALHAFRQTLRKIARGGTAIILVTHNLHDILPEISRVILMKEGRVWRDGPKAEVLTDGSVGEVFGLPVHVREENGWYYATGF
ncbi:MAG: ATP-binding cassette domain-containing protein [Methanomicrobiales archaeon]|nr:ATP-binding cassette domain-containing protein [Methanomicrobiales archaeon]MDI6876781.1 ATP-binding cassette domain-containing protein [Methanomicrobiales archaeon]